MSRNDPSPTRVDPFLGPVRKCASCREWWPEEPTFYVIRDGQVRGHQCRACNVNSPLVVRRRRQERTKAWYAALRADVAAVREARAR